MDRNDFYKFYQSNIEVLENQMNQVKKLVQINLGKLYVQKENPKIKIEQLKKTEYDILSGNRLYTFLLCSWFEARLNKILYENSSAGFTDGDRRSIKSENKMGQKWKKCFNIAVCKCFSFPDGHQNYSAMFTSNSDEKKQYDYIFSLMDEIDEAITIRNRLAHGQWLEQLNSKSTNLAGSDITSFFNKYDNIQKLDLLFSVYKLISEIISDYIIFKDKGSDFEKLSKQIDKKANQIKNLNQQITSKNFDKYCYTFKQKEINRIKAMTKINK